MHGHMNLKKHGKYYVVTRRGKRLNKYPDTQRNCHQ